MNESLKGRPLRRFIRLLAPDKKAITFIYTYAIINGVINLSLPLGIQAILSLTLANELSSAWGVLIVVVTAGTALAGAIQIMQLSLVERLQQEVFARASFEFAFRLPRLRMEALSKYYPPELVNRFFDILNVQKGLPKILIDFTTAILQIFFGVILLAFYHPFFVAFGVALIIILALIIRITGPKGLKTSLQESDYKYRVAYWLEEIARALSTFKLAGPTRITLKKADGLVRSYLEARKQHFRVLVVQYSSVVGFKTLITAALLGLGSILLIEREINLGQFVASEIVIILVINSVEKLVTSAETIYDVLTAMEKLGKITDLPLERHKGVDCRTLPVRPNMAISMRNLGFSFPGDPHPTFSDISLEIKSGEKVCFSGMNGSGREVLLSVIAGLYEQYDGLLAFDDIPYRSYDPIFLRGYVGDCLSQKTLFRGTLEENLTVGKTYIQRDQVQEALKQVDLLEWSQDLQMGLNTELTPEDQRFPPEIVRRLILARCLLKEPRLLMIEGFHRMGDKGTRQKIAEYVTAQPWTLIALSNDPNLASLCDRVVVLNGGQIQVQGTFEDISNMPFASQLFDSPC